MKSKMCPVAYILVSSLLCVCLYAVFAAPGLVVGLIIVLGTAGRSYWVYRTKKQLLNLQSILQLPHVLPETADTRNTANHNIGEVS